MTIDPVPFDLHAALDDVMELFAARADEKGIELVLRVAASVPRSVVGDAGRLRQVLVNLLGNALKFTQQGHALLDVDAAASGAGVRLVIRIEDTGIGIPLDRQVDIFEKFTQADSSTTRKYGGTGLGLSISKLLVELMHGELTLDSEPGRGSCFTIALELADAPVGAALPTRERSLRVLVVDDYPLAREAVVQRLSGWGMSSQGAGSCAEALAQLEEATHVGSPFDVVLIDAVLRGEAGVDLANAVRANPLLRGVPLVLLSPAGVRGDAVRSRELGFMACLGKPVRFGKLRDCLDAVGADPEAAASQPAASGGLEQQLANLLALDRAPRALVARDNAVNRKLARRSRSWLRRDAGREWSRGRRAGARERALRRRLHGRADARTRWIRGDARDPPQQRDRGLGADRRHDGQRDGGRSRALPRGRDGRLHQQADRSEAPR